MAFNNKSSIFKIGVLLLFVLIPLGSIAQQKETIKAEKALKEKKYERALKFSEKALKKDSKDILALIYKSQSLYYLFKTPSTSEKYSNGLKNAVKAAQRAMEKDEENLVETVFGDYLKLLATENNAEGEKYFKQERYNKAEQYFELSVKFNPNDTNALFYLGSCYWYEEQRPAAVELFKTVAQNNFSTFSESGFINQAHFKAYRFLTEYYMGEEKWDSANIYVSMGLEMFPDDHILKGNRYGLYRVRVRTLPPSLNYLAEVRAALQDYPSDSFFLIKENALYIYLFKNALSNNEIAYCDSLLGIFVLDRLERANREDRGWIEKFDIFVGNKPIEIFRKLLDYSTSYYHKDIFAWLIQKWVSELLNKDTVSAKEYLTIAENEFNAGNKEYAVLMLLAEYNRPGRKGENELQLISMLTKWSKSQLPLLAIDYAHEMFGLIRKTKNKSKVEPVYKSIKYRFIDSLAANNYFFRAYSIFEEAIQDFPADKKYLQEDKLRNLANLDFKMNYYGSRIATWGKEPKAGEVAFTTNMLPANCEIGSVSKDVYERVLQRVNYFRRVSGVRKQVYFTKDLNEKCQFAALSFEANKNLTHNMVDGLRCFTEAGKEGADKSLLVRESNPSLAITALMGDKAGSQGNRRWLQYPLSLNMGFGAGPTSQVLWVMDNANVGDSVYYKERFIAYPNAGYTPKMLCFSKWTFSVFDDVEGAVIKVKNSAGKEIPVIVEPVVNGYAMPTLVFAPEFELDKGENDQKFSVNIKLKNGKTFSYDVTLFTPDLK
ncbi:MAG: hypothetical protein J5I91_06785 [Bacteroidetes bacterium]|nr:hypothetical protein [Bacteroidota bacterium]